MVRPPLRRLGLIFARRSRRRACGARAEADRAEADGAGRHAHTGSWLSSRLAGVLLRDYGIGHISATRVQLYAEACLEDIVACGGSPDEVIRDLANLGRGRDGSTNVKNVQRDLQQVLTTILPMDMPISMVPLTVKYPMDKSTTEIMHPIVFPHDVVHAFHLKCPAQFANSFVGNTGAAETWWTRQWSARWVQEHPAMAGKTCAGETSNVIPYWFHGDETHYAVRGQSLVLSWCSRNGIAKSPWLSRFIFCIVPCKIMVNTVTLNQLLYYFILSC